MQNDSEIEELLGHASQGSIEAKGRLLKFHMNRLRLMIVARLDPRLSARMDPSDVLQDIMTEAARTLDVYLQRRPIDFYVWIRGIAERRIIDLHRRHLHAAKRSVRREVKEIKKSFSSSSPLVEQLANSQTSPSQKLIRQEERAALQAALEEVSDDDRELIVLRYVEQLPLAEVSEVLGISISAAKSRHLRAIARLTKLVQELRGEQT
ncbi:MAG: sigma-70 family RNA polymerase sigma factor [Gemmataceae bacterium]